MADRRKRRFPGMVIAAFVILGWGRLTVLADFKSELQQAAELYGQQKFEEAAAAYKKLTSDYSQEPGLYQAYQRLADASFQLKRFQDGADAAGKVLSYDDGTTARQTVLSQAVFTLAKCYEGLERYDDAQKAFLKCALWYPWCHWNSVRAIEHLKGMNTYRQRYGESLAVAKLYFWACSPDDKTMAEAVEFLTKALHAADGNRTRTEQFLLFQKYGPAGPDGFVGTADDLKNILDDIPLPDDPEREAALKVSREYYRWDYPTYDQKRKKGYLLLLTSQPKAALAEFVKGYETAPTDPTGVKDATDDILKALKALTGNLQAGQRFLAFQKYGAAGPDNLAGTADDLTDPVKELLGEP